MLALLTRSEMTGTQKDHALASLAGDEVTRSLSLSLSLSYIITRVAPHFSLILLLGWHPTVSTPYSLSLSLSLTYLLTTLSHLLKKKKKNSRRTLSHI